MRSLDCADRHAKARNHCRDPNVENARALLALTHNQLAAKLYVWLLLLDLEVVMPLLFRERVQVWPYLVVLTVAFILFQPLRNRVVGMHWCAWRQQYQERRSQHVLCSWRGSQTLLPPMRLA